VPDQAVGGFACQQHSDWAEIWETRPPVDLEAPALPEGWTIAVIGRSVQDRTIEAIVRPVETPRRRVVVVGGIHGNEVATPPAVRGFVTATIDADVEVWLVPDANPDGTAAGLRCNANGVDLNRNFPWGWRPDTGGPSPLSEPETQALTSLIEGLRPDVVVWVHQPLDYVSAVGASPDALEIAWATGSGLPVRPDVTQHGGGESWTAFVADIPAVLVEIGGWDASEAIGEAQRAGFEAMLGVLESTDVAG
jgi:protein MpaA